MIVSCIRKLALPGQRVRDDGLQVVEMRPPFEGRTDKVGRGNDVGGVARAPAGELDLEIDAGRPA